MGKIRDFFLGAEYRDSLENPSVELSEALLDGPRSYTGVHVSTNTALGNVAVYAAVRVLAEAVGSLPLHTYSEVGRGRERVDDPRAYVLNKAPNPEMTAMQLWSTVMGHLNLWGNAYLYKVISPATGQVKELWPLRPDRTGPVRTSSNQLAYVTYTDQGQPQYFLKDEVIHISNFGTGDLGISPIGVARQAIGISIAAEEYAGRYYANDAKPGGIIQYQGKLTDEQFKSLVQRWQAGHQGLKNSHLVGILTDGATWTDVGINPQDSQFLETRKFQVREIARIFRVPPHKIGDLEGTITYASIEQQSIDFVTDSIRPWCVRVEQALNNSLFSSDIDRKAGIFCEFNLDALLRGDTKTRYEAYAIGKQNGWLSANDIRDKENLPLIDGGDEYLSMNQPAPGAQDQPTEDPSAPIDSAS